MERATPVESAARRPTPLYAVGLAILCVLVSRILFGYSEAGPSADVLMPFFPFITGGFGIVSAWYAWRAWQVTRAATDKSAGRVFLLTVTFLALLTDIVVIGFAALVGLFILTGPIVR